MRRSIALALGLLTVAGCGPTTPTQSASTPASSASPGAAATSKPTTAPSTAATPDMSAKPATIKLTVDGTDTPIEQTAAWFTAPGSTQGLFWDLGKAAGQGLDQTARGAKLAAGEAVLTLQLRNQPETDFIYHFHDFAQDKLQYALTVVMVRNTGTRAMVWGHQADHRPTDAALTVKDGKVDLVFKITLDADKRQNDGTTPKLDVDIKGLAIPEQR